MLGAGENSHLRLFTSLMNPLTVDQSVLRTSLIPGLMTTVKTNMLHEGRDLKLFEWGKTFIRKEGDQQPIEKIYLAAIMTGLCQEKSWHDNERHCDFYDIKGAVEGLLKALGLGGVHFQRENGFPGLDPEVSSGIYCSDGLIGQVGKVDSSVIEAYDLKNERAYLFELDVEALLTLLSVTREFHPFPKFPAVFRDMSILVERRIESAKIIEIIRKEGGELLESVQIFDLYEGEKIDPSEKAIAFRISYRSAHETLEGEKINSLHESIMDKIRHETGGRLREG
jgi:phenylalanyl-tRNA synthetase beta chain